MKNFEINVLGILCPHFKNKNFCGAQYIRKCENYLEVKHTYINSDNFTCLRAYSLKARISLKNLLEENVIELKGRTNIGEVFPDGPMGMVQVVSDCYKRGDEYENTRVIGMYRPKLFQRFRADEYYLV